MGFDMAAPDPSLIPEGIHLVKILSAKEKRSKTSGNGMWEVEIGLSSDHTMTFQDWWMLTGKMAWAMRKRLALLGFADDAKVEAYQIEGLQFYAAIMHGKDRDGDTVARIANRYEGSTVGMWSEMDPPGAIADENAQASNLFGEPEPVKVDPTTLPVDHPDYRP